MQSTPTIGTKSDEPDEQSRRPTNSETIRDPNGNNWIELIGGYFPPNALPLILNVSETFGITIDGIAAASLNIAGAARKIERELWLSVKDNSKFKWDAEVKTFSSDETSPSQQQCGSYFVERDPGVTSDGIARVAQIFLVLPPKHFPGGNRESRRCVVTVVDHDSGSQMECIAERKPVIIDLCGAQLQVRQPSQSVPSDLVTVPEKVK